MTIGERIREARKNAGLTQKELGNKIGVSGALIGQYETGIRNPKIETLQKICNAIGVDLVYDLLFGISYKSDIGGLVLSPSVPLSAKDLSSLAISATSNTHYELIIQMLHKLNNRGIIVAYNTLCQMIDNPTFTEPDTPDNYNFADFLKMVSPKFDALTSEPVKED